MDFHSHPILLAFTILFVNTFFINYMFLGVVDSATPSIVSDKEALISFKSQLSYKPTNLLSTWDVNNSNSSPCNWTGVVCSNESDPRVIALDLSGLGLTGSLSPHIGNLSFLNSLQLQDNKFTGTLPHQITNLSRLRVLNLSSNGIQGALPSNISSLRQLQVLDLMANEITSKLPEELGLLTNLQVLKLGRNHLFGAIPPTIGNLSSLTQLNLGTNTLHGNVPSDLGRLQSLEVLDITINNLTGTLPPSIYNLSSLVDLAVASNDLWGEIPYDVGVKLPNLLVFNFCINKFTGRIPGSLHNLTRIEVIRMAHNLLEGTVPPGLGNLPFLKMYNIGFNKVVTSVEDGLSFITSLTNSTQLNFLAIDGNQLEGVIPESIGNLSKVLSKLYMGGNRIYGKIPTSIGSLSSLTLLNLTSNSISGEIPPQIGQLQQLQMLGLALNNLSGGIPNSLGNLLKLNNLDLSGNSLLGSVPSFFGNFQSLLSMDLSNNKLNGSIPKESLNLPSLSTILNLSNNFLNGPLPEDIGLLENVVTIDLSKNLLSGHIPSSIRGCKSLEALFMANNRFSGPIPNALGEVKGLEMLDLSSNQLSGFIPKDLENLEALKYLNLSFNNLEGEVPKGGVFGNISSVHLEGNKELCSHLECRNSEGRRRAVIVVIISAIVATLALCIIVFSLLQVRKSKARIAQDHSEATKGQFQMVSYEELRGATGNFKEENLIGNGSFGTVYKGYLSEGTAVAIKVLNTQMTGSWKSFAAECEALRNMRHRNLVRLITSCSSIDFKNMDFLALVYEYLSNGSLEDWIRGKKLKANGEALNIADRLNLAIDVATALDYMHHDCEVPVVHCDIKPSNILLDEDLTAKLGDFGLARLLMEKRGTQTSISSTNVIRGSIGYIPPEYGQGEKASTAGDTYSFGIMLLELFTGKCPTDERFTGDLNLPRWVQSAFPKNLMQVIIDSELLLHAVYLDEDDGMDDEYVSPEIEHDCLAAIIEVGLSCTRDSPDGRIIMRHALHKLKHAQLTFLKHANGT
ncbi:hypothetical protein FNV43_RR04194 [Rhamnella rubrinervis]|uniref:non-specific serine/threonine protein kinase n=1 Tax=Rhamnella rubrinervis TaxID=2594499 RepID=A0A8K0HKJ8_9ROSA|nr:hypothetical protein FNV43_RR04194 [Rhamnella rubrinervis]